MEASHCAQVTPLDCRGGNKCVSLSRLISRPSSPPPQSGISYIQTLSSNFISSNLRRSFKLSLPFSLGCSKWRRSRQATGQLFAARQFPRKLSLFFSASFFLSTCIAHEANRELAGTPADTNKQSAARARRSPWGG